MHEDRSIFAINDQVQCVRCSYEGDWKAQNGDIKSPPEEKWTEFKTFDSTLRPGDMVIVPTNIRHGFTVVRVEQVGHVPDLKSEEPMRWIAAKFDPKPFRQVVQMEDEAKEKLREIERKRQRQEIVKTLVGEETAEINQLAIAQQKKIGQN